MAFDLLWLGDLGLDHRAGVDAEVAPEDTLLLHLDVYLTRRGLWNPQYGGGDAAAGLG